MDKLCIANISDIKIMPRSKRLRGILKTKIGSLLWSIVRGVIAIGICFIILKPLYIKISVSFMAERDLYDSSIKYVPKHFTLTNYKIAIGGLDYLKTTIKTIFVCAGVSMLQLISCLLTAYGFARFRFPGKKLLFGCVLLTMIVPPQIIMLPLLDRKSVV